MRRQLTLTDRLAPAPRGWRWLTLRVDAACSQCDDIIPAGSEALAKASARVCVECGIANPDDVATL